jgi:hypothetical protein
MDLFGWTSVRGFGLGVGIASCYQEDLICGLAGSSRPRFGSPDCDCGSSRAAQRRNLNKSQPYEDKRGLLIIFDGGSGNNGSPKAEAYGSYQIITAAGRSEIKRLQFSTGTTNNEAEYKLRHAERHYQMYLGRLPSQSRLWVRLRDG